MKLTSKGRYALSAMLDVALSGAAQPVNLAEIAERQGVSMSYLEHIFVRLKRADLVCSVRGPGGGYKLSRDADEISVAQVIHAMNENFSAINNECDAEVCCQNDQKNNREPCLSHELWVKLSLRIERFLDTISIGELINQDLESGSDSDFFTDVSDAKTLKMKENI